MLLSKHPSHGRSNKISTIYANSMFAVQDWRHLESEIVEAIKQTAAGGDAAAVEFMKWWDADPDKLTDQAAAAINKYLGNVSTKCKGEYTTHSRSTLVGTASMVLFECPPQLEAQHPTTFLLVECAAPYKHPHWE